MVMSSVARSESGRLVTVTVCHPLQVPPLPPVKVRAPGTVSLASSLESGVTVTVAPGSACSFTR